MTVTIYISREKGGVDGQERNLSFSVNLALKLRFFKGVKNFLKP
jgi:hypothetical protein